MNTTDKILVYGVLPISALLIGWLVKNKMNRVEIIKYDPQKRVVKLKTWHPLKGSQVIDWKIEDGIGMNVGHLSLEPAYSNESDKSTFYGIHVLKDGVIWGTINLEDNI